MVELFAVAHSSSVQMCALSSHLYEMCFLQFDCVLSVRLYIKCVPSVTPKMVIFGPRREALFAVLYMQSATPRPPPKQVADSIMDAAKEEADAAKEKVNAPHTVSRRRVKWTRMVATGSGRFDKSTDELEVDMTDGGQGEAGGALDLGGSAPLITAIDDEIEAVRLAASEASNQASADNAFLNMDHVENMVESVTASVHEMAQISAPYLAQSKAEAEAFCAMGDVLSSDLERLGADAVRPLCSG